MQPQPQIYLSNKQLLVEIHKSKVTYCYFTKKEYADHDTIVSSISDINNEVGERVLQEKAAVRRKPVEPLKTSVDQLVFRVMTYEHVPLCGDKKKRSRAAAGEGHLRTIFPPFKHYILRDGQAVEVGRSHWQGDLETGEFCQDHGRLTNRLASMLLMLVDKYAGKGNWRGYTYNDEMQSSALLQLSQTGLQFDESKGENPFAFYTTIMKNSFTRVLNVEKKNQNIRDDLLIMAGATPSYTRQIDQELSAKFADQAQPAAKMKRGRKPKIVVEKTEDIP